MTAKYNLHGSNFVQLPAVFKPPAMKMTLSGLSELFY